MSDQQLYKKTGTILLVLAGISLAVDIATLVMYQKVYIYGLSAFAAFLFLGVQMTIKAKRQ